MTERKTEEQKYCGTYEIYNGNKLVGRQELDPRGVSIIYVHYHDVNDYRIEKVK